MMKSNRGPKDPEDLRTRAEESLKSEPDRPGDTRLEEANSLIHELRVHQIELEMQNEELRRVQNDLEISRSKYADLYDFAPVGYLTLNKHGQIVDLNLSAARQLGMERGRLINQHFQYFVFQPDKKEFLSHINAIFDNRERQTTEVRLSSIGGEQFYIRLESIYAEGEDGVPLCRTSISNITKQKQAEEALRENEKRYKQLIESVTDYIFTVKVQNGGSFITIHGPGCATVTGYTSDDYESNQYLWLQMVHEKDLDVVKDRINRLLLGEATLPLEHRIIHRNGSIRWVISTLVATHNKKGKLISYDGIITDITDRKQAEISLQKAHYELERRVEERTAALGKANEELRQIPSKLISVQEEERKRLASELHDSIGQTLAAVKFWVEMALKLRDGGDGNAALNHLDQFVPILQHSIEETRSIYMGLRPSMLDSTGLLATLEWLRQECMKLYPERHIELEVGVAEETIPKNLKVNIFRIAQEALNNIAKHSKAEWVDISLSKNGGGIELVVSDDGVGMNLDIIMQTVTATSLGLTSMRERAELTGGSFLIESTPGEGTTIRASWPIEAEDQLQKGGIT